MEQLTLTAEQARDEAIGRVERGHTAWVRGCLLVVEDIARREDEFTTDAVWNELERIGARIPDEPRALGAVMRRASRYGVCEATDRTRKSRRPECHARPVRVWRSLIYRARERHG